MGNSKRHQAVGIGPRGAQEVIAASIECGMRAIKLNTKTDQRGRYWAVLFGRFVSRFCRFVLRTPFLANPLGK